ncbi:MAG: class I SAM-dependent methyltransferase [Deinococcota bacterium]
MATNYETLYQTERHALGQPTKAFVSFFESLPASSLTVVDVGCGQGRDSLFIARLGHQVTSIDISPTGIKQLLEDAGAEGLSITGIVADLSEYQFIASYDIAVVDRTLHMLAPELRLNLLARVMKVISAEGYILIADEPRNLPAMLELFTQDAGWQVMKHQQGFLFVRKATYTESACIPNNA